MTPGRAYSRNAILVILSGLLLLAGQAALAAQAPVSVFEFGFSPDPLTIHLGTTVNWTNDGALSHTSTSDGEADGTGLFGPALWDSGNLAPDDTFVFTFNWAGTYRYHCSIHPNSMSAYISLPVRIAPKRGALGTTFTVTWGIAPAPQKNLVFHLLWKTPSSTWQDWQTNTSSLSAIFQANEVGTYRFRAQMVRLHHGQVIGASYFSPISQVRIQG